MSRSMVGSEIFKRDMAQKMQPKRLPGQEDKLHGDSIKITETRDNEDATHNSMLQLYTQDHKVNETSIEELNLIAMAERSAIEATRNNINNESSDFDQSEEDSQINLPSLYILENKNNPQLAVAEVTGSSNISDSPDQVCVSEGHQITLTSQDHDDPLIYAQLQNDAGLSYNTVHKKSFLSNRDVLVNNPLMKASFLNENLIETGNDYSI